MKKLLILQFFVLPFLLRGSLQTELQELQRSLGALESALKLKTNGKQFEDEKYLKEKWAVAEKMLEAFNNQSKDFLQKLDKFKSGQGISQEDFEELEQADPIIFLDETKLLSFVNFKQFAKNFPGLYQDIRAFLYEINNNIKKLNEQLTMFNKANFKEITTGAYEKSDERLIHLPGFIDEVKERLDAWRNAILYNSIVKPIEDELGLKKTIGKSTINFFPA